MKYFVKTYEELAKIAREKGLKITARNCACGESPAVTLENGDIVIECEACYNESDYMQRY